jgi:hypothetical protein
MIQVRNERMVMFEDFKRLHGYDPRLGPHVPTKLWGTGPPIVTDSSADSVGAAGVCIKVGVSSNGRQMARALGSGPPALVVNLGGGDVAVTEQFLDLDDVHASVEE